jgi:FkbM family methyltransferase
MYIKKCILTFLLVCPFVVRTTSDLYKILYKNSLIPKNTELRKRVLTTICCDDCQDLPKVERAGKVIENNDQVYQLAHNGIKLIKDCYYGSWMTTLITLLQGHHEPQEEKAFHEVLKHLPSNAVMIELGSYWGFYSMWFQKQILEAHNFLIEPDPKNIEIGKKNFELNGMKGNFTHAMVGAASSGESEFVDWNYVKHSVPVVSIDDFARDHNIDFIHMLHSDIQGAEVEMLKGCAKLMAEKRIGYYFISTHRGVHELCLDLLHNYGLEIIVSINRDESFSADGLIVAKLPDIPGPDGLNITKRTERFCALIEEIGNE